MRMPLPPPNRKMKVKGEEKKKETCLPLDGSSFDDARTCFNSAIGKTQFLPKSSPAGTAVNCTPNIRLLV